MMKNVGVVLTALVITATLAMAAENGGRLNIRDAVQLNGKQLTAGEYTVRWEGTGPSVQVTVTLYKKTVMTTTGTVKELDKPAEKDSVVYKGSGGKFDQIAEIRFAGKKTALVFEGQPQGAN